MRRCCTIRVVDLLDALPPGERAAWSTAFYAGLRVGELRALRWHHIDFDTGIITVQAGWDDMDGEQSTKTQAGERTIPLVGRLRADLARHKLATGRDSDALCFGRTSSSAFTRSTLPRAPSSRGRRPGLTRSRRMRRATPALATSPPRASRRRKHRPRWDTPTFAPR